MCTLSLAAVSDHIICLYVPVGIAVIKTDGEGAAGFYDVEGVASWLVQEVLPQGGMRAVYYKYRFAILPVDTICPDIVWPHGPVVLHWLRANALSIAHVTHQIW